jgi:hypothetical protein
MPTCAAAAALLITAAFITAACEDDNPNLVTNPDAVVLDTGGRAPIPLAPGLEITYQATFTRFETAAAQVQGQYRVTLTITDVVDNGDDAPSEVSFTMTDETQTMNPDWSRQIDFDSWVGRLGPSVDRDQVDPAPVQMTLDGAPSIPPAPTGTEPKELPKPSTFFIDIRDEAMVAADWSAEQTGRTPQVNLEPQGSGLILEANGLDEDQIVTHPVEQRRVELTYGTDGILDDLTERIGDPAGFPRTTARLDRVEAP